MSAARNSRLSKETEGLVQCLVKYRDHLKQDSATHAARSEEHEVNHDSSIQYIKSCCSVSSEYEELDAHMPQVPAMSPYLLTALLQLAE